eukprot:4499864-Amphidinium_carterae.1
MPQSKWLISGSPQSVKTSKANQKHQSSTCCESLRYCRLWACGKTVPGAVLAVSGLSVQLPKS